MNGHARNILALLCAALLAAALLGALVIWTLNLAPSFRARRAANAAIAGRLKEAKALGLTYESALAAPEKALGKPALWCLRRGDLDRTYYNGEEGKPVYIKNSGRMPSTVNYTGKHQNCADALLTIATVSAVSYGSFSAVRLEADFIAYP